MNLIYSNTYGMIKLHILDFKVNNKQSLKEKNILDVIVQIEQKAIYIAKIMLHYCEFSWVRYNKLNLTSFKT